MKKNLQNIFIKKESFLKLTFFLIADAILISLSAYLAFIVRFEGQIPNQYSLNILGVILLSLIITIPIFYFSKLYYFTWSYVSTDELISLIKATGLSFLILTASFFILREHPIFTGFPRSTLFISYFFIFIFCGGLRFSKRIYLQIFSKGKEEKERTLIIGAGDAGEQILRSILASKSRFFSPIGFVDDNPAKQGIFIHGLKVLGKIEDIPKIVKNNQVKGMIIAMPSAGALFIKKAVEKGREAGLRKIKIIPLFTEIIDGQVSVSNLKDLQVEDLLLREPVLLDFTLIENFIKNKKILITGAAGSIGSELCQQVANFKPSLLVMLDQDETGIFNISEEIKRKFPNLKFSPVISDIQDKDTIDYIFNKFQPEVVFHAAAYKHVPLMEIYPTEAVKNNIFGTKTLADAALKYEVNDFIFISTDKAINPSSIMGTSKRIGEMIGQVLNQRNSTKFTSVRFGNVLDSRGSVIPIFKERIQKGGAIEITHPEMKRYFMLISEACLLVMQAGAIGKGGEVFVLDMGKPIKILDLAKELIKLSGLEPDKDIPIVFTQPRPGEKLFEEILTTKEETVATKSEKIFITKLSEVNEEKLNSCLKKLKEVIINKDKKIIVETLKEIVPSYRPPSY